MKKRLLDFDYFKSDFTERAVAFQEVCQSIGVLQGGYF